MRLIALGAFVLLSACTTVPVMVNTSTCPANLTRMSSAELYFGRDIEGKASVSDADWQNFLDTEVTPRFPDGLTTMDAAGQWRGENGAVTREPSKVVMIVLSGATDEAQKIDAIRAAYKTRFKQEAVMLIERPGCVGF